ncbi:tetratricopeptide repeat protein [Paracoccus jeotgali]|uniref:tetratricopeptide repeat protein n=1 Tax=Paracoccus jeotgali TaxID=2065379 RepID=UPI0028A62E72|nr:tetratricopeptide repeat protein [Paracoccus jeotgali]
MTHDTDSFIDEVTEEVRRDRLYRLMRRYGWIGLALIAAIVGGAAWREYDIARHQAAAEAWGDAVLAAQQAEDRRAALASLDGAGNSDRAALGLLLTAGATRQGGDAAGATDLLADAAATASDPVLRDLARLKAVLVAGETMDAAARDRELAELSKPGAPFRLLALEQKAVALIAAGRDQDALTLIREIQSESGVSQTMNARLAEMTVALGGRATDPAAADRAGLPQAVETARADAAPAADSAAAIATD